MSNRGLLFRFLLLASLFLCAPAAAQYTAADLYTLTAPAGTYGPGPSPQGVNATDSGQLVGDSIASLTNQGVFYHAVYWSGGAPVDLNPTSAGYSMSIAEGIGGGQQVGLAAGPATGSYSNNTPAYYNHAMVWSGSASSAVDLNPTNLTGFPESQAYATDGVHQVGEGLLTDQNGDLFNHAMLWSGTAASAVDLHPTQFSGYNLSIALGVSGNQQVGALFSTSGSPHQAILWSGSAASAINLDPKQLENDGKGTEGSGAFGIGGGQEVGYAVVNGTGLHDHAVVWTGTAASAVDLEPAGSTDSIAYATNGTQQVGIVNVPVSTFGVNYVPHAMLWSGTAASAVDLNSLLPSSFGASDNSTATSIDAAGDVFGFAQDSSGQFHAVAWIVPPHAASGSVTSGSNQSTSVAGRSPGTGDVKVTFSSSSGGTFSSTNGLDQISTLSSQTAPINFSLPTSAGLVEEWDLSFTGTFTGGASLVFHYDASLLAPGIDPSTLQIEHFTGGQWVPLTGTVDPVADTITVSTDSFSPFALAVVPEPAAMTVVALGLLLGCRRRQH